MRCFSIFLRHCVDCTVLVLSQQFRARDCRRISAYLCCSTQPIIENTVAAKFACLQVNYPELEGKKSPTTKPECAILNRNTFSPSQGVPFWTRTLFLHPRVCHFEPEHFSPSQGVPFWTRTLFLHPRVCHFERKHFFSISRDYFSVKMTKLSPLNELYGIPGKNRLETKNNTLLLSIIGVRTRV